MKLSMNDEFVAMITDFIELNDPSVTKDFVKTVATRVDRGLDFDHPEYAKSHWNYDVTKPYEELNNVSLIPITSGTESELNWFLSEALEPTQRKLFESFYDRHSFPYDQYYAVISIDEMNRADEKQTLLGVFNSYKEALMEAQQHYMECGDTLQKQMDDCFEVYEETLRKFGFVNDPFKLGIDVQQLDIQSGYAFEVTFENDKSQGQITQMCDEWMTYVDGKIIAEKVVLYNALEKVMRDFGGDTITVDYQDDTNSPQYQIRFQTELEQELPSHIQLTYNVDVPKELGYQKMLETVKTIQSEIELVMESLMFKDFCQNQDLASFCAVDKIITKKDEKNR